MGRKHFRSSDIYDVVASNIKKCRKDAGLTQVQVAELTGYSHEFIRRIEAPNCKKILLLKVFTLFQKHLIFTYQNYSKQKRSQAINEAAEKVVKIKSIFRILYLNLLIFFISSL